MRTSILLFIAALWPSVSGQTMVRYINQSTTPPTELPWFELPGTVEWWSPEWPAGPLLGELKLVDLYIPALFGLLTAVPDGQNVCDATSYWPVSAAQTNANNYVAVWFQLTLLQCAPAFNGPMDLVFLDKYGDAGFVAAMMIAPEASATMAMHAGCPKMSQINYKTNIPHMTTGTYYMGAGSPADLNQALMTIATVGLPGGPVYDPSLTLHGELSPNFPHASTPEFVGALYFCAALNILFALYAMYVLVTKVTLLSAAALVVFLEGVVAPPLRVVKLLFVDPLYFRPFPFPLLPYFGGGGVPVDNLVSNSASIILIGIYFLLGLGRKQRVIEIVTWTVCGALILFLWIYFLTQQSYYRDLFSAMPFVNGFMDLSVVFDAFSVAFNVLQGLKTAGLVFAALIIGANFVLTVKTACVVMKTMKQSSTGVKPAVKRMMFFMIPNLFFLITLLIATVVSIWPDQDISYAATPTTGYGIAVLVSSMLMQWSSLFAGICQVMIFNKGDSSSSSSSSSLSSLSS